jgi:HPt (histidine-containing phosphotransfer) domain-containing protein
LFRMVEELCGIASTTPSAAEDHAPVAQKMNAQELLARVGGSPEVLREVARIFLEDTPIRMSAIRDAIKRRDGTELAKAAHALGGSAGMLGAIEISEEARRIEALGRSGSVVEVSEILASFEGKISAFERLLAGIVAGAGKSKVRGRKPRGTRSPRGIR